MRPASASRSKPRVLWHKQVSNDLDFWNAQTHIHQVRAYRGFTQFGEKALLIHTYTILYPFLPQKQNDLITEHHLSGWQLEKDTRKAAQPTVGGQALPLTARFCGLKLIHCLASSSLRAWELAQHRTEDQRRSWTKPCVLPNRSLEI